MPNGLLVRGSWDGDRPMWIDPSMLACVMGLPLDRLLGEPSTSVREPQDTLRIPQSMKPRPLNCGEVFVLDRIPRSASHPPHGRLL